jgi:hypothetical protein
VIVVRRRDPREWRLIPAIAPKLLDRSRARNVHRESDAFLDQDGHPVAPRHHPVIVARRFAQHVDDGVPALVGDQQPPDSLPDAIPPAAFQGGVAGRGRREGGATYSEPGVLRYSCEDGGELTPGASRGLDGPPVLTCGPSSTRRHEDLRIVV